jgi:hypothetical protein
MSYLISVSSFVLGGSFIVMLPVATHMGHPSNPVLVRAEDTSIVSQDVTIYFQTEPPPTTLLTIKDFRFGQSTSYHCYNNTSLLLEAERNIS